ncbi:MAG: hypothetical protein Q9222_003277 [Ikaeria aurantiellina]
MDSTDGSSRHASLMRDANTDNSCRETQSGVKPQETGLVLQDEPSSQTDRKDTIPDSSSSLAPSISSDKLAKEEDFKSDIPNETKDEGTTSEIQSIMDQFDGGGQPSGEDDIMSPRLDLANARLGDALQHPPRKSSLEPIGTTRSTEKEEEQRDISYAMSTKELPSLYTESISQNQGKAPSVRSFSTPQSSRFSTHSAGDTTSPQSSISTLKTQPPKPDPDPETPFDFHNFLEQLRHRTADPVARFLRSFLQEFGKKQWMVHEQVKIISDFLTFITGKMAQCEVWRAVSDIEFDNAKEGMEKLVTTRLYSFIFSPEIPSSAPPASAKGRKKNMEKIFGPERKGQHQEDVERDEVLGQKVRIYRWVQEEHLDIPQLGEDGRRFMSFAQQQLLKIKMYRAPRDKVVCVLNCCKVIFGFLSTSKSADTSADSFVPLLIYAVLRANPEHLVSNVQYILRFRNQDKLGGEAGYYLSSLMGAIQFIETLDRTSLTISDEDFEKRVEASVSEIAEGHEEEEAGPPAPPPPPPRPLRPTHISEKSGLSEPQMIPRNSMDGENTPSRPLTPHVLADGRTGTDRQEDNNAVSGLLRTIQRPLSSIGRMFSEETSSRETLGPSNQSHQPPQLDMPLRLSPAVFQPPRNSLDESRPQRDPSPNHARQMTTEAAAARQASVEAAEAHRVQRIEHQDVVE